MVSDEVIGTIKIITQRSPDTFANNTYRNFRVALDMFLNDHNFSTKNTNKIEYIYGNHPVVAQQERLGEKKTQGG
jgi:hypothetical protein